MFLLWEKFDFEQWNIVLGGKCVYDETLMKINWEQLIQSLQHLMTISPKSCFWPDQILEEFDRKLLWPVDFVLSMRGKIMIPMHNVMIRGLKWVYMSEKVVKSLTRDQTLYWPCLRNGLSDWREKERIGCWANYATSTIYLIHDLGLLL